jgi:DNA-binding transcriptional MerR regulator
MRQLDLFGSLFDSPAPEEKPAEAEVAKKKVSKEKEPDNDSKQQYSVVGLAKEMLAKTELKDLDDAKNTETSQDSKSYTRALSLFDLNAGNDETEVGDVEEDVIAEEEIDKLFEDEPMVSHSFTANAAGLIDEVEEEILEETVGEVGSMVEEEVEVDEIVEPVLNKELPLETFSDHDTVEEPEVEVVKSPTPKPKVSKADRERTGSVIFTDGKITVKLKNKPGIGPVITKEKKEKIKKLPQKRGRKSFKEIDAEVDLIEIPEDEILFQKQYYPISEVAKWFRVNTSLLRFWENEFDVLKPRKNRKGDRLFRPEDVKNLQLIYQLLRQRKYTIDGAKDYIKTNKRKADVQLQLTQTLQKFKGFLLDLKANLQP